MDDGPHNDWGYEPSTDAAIDITRKHIAQSKELNALRARLAEVKGALRLYAKQECHYPAATHGRGCIRNLTPSSWCARCVATSLLKMIGATAPEED